MYKSLTRKTGFFLSSVFFSQFLQQSLYLRDILENMCNRKSLRETTDFEWRRCIRCYFHPVGTAPNFENLLMFKIINILLI